MKTNKLKLLSICLIAALCSEAQCADNFQNQRKNDEPIIHHQTQFAPTGSVIAYAGSETNAYKGQGSEWLLCDGGEYFSKDYPKLYEIIKTTFVPDTERLDFLKFNESHKGEEKFRVPDLRGRVIVGVDGATGRVTSNNTLGASGGEESVILTVSQLAKHNHRIVDSNAMNGTLPLSTALGGAGANLNNVALSQETGGNQPHNNMQPYLLLNYIINTGKMNNRPDNEIDQLKQKINQLESSQRNIQQAVITNPLSINSSTYTDVTGLSVTIKPTDATCKVLINAMITGSMEGGNGAGIRLMRNATPIGIGNAMGTNIQATSIMGAGRNSNSGQTLSITYLDSPNTTEITTYSLQASTSDGVKLNINSTSSTTGSNYFTGISTITTTEVKF